MTPHDPACDVIDFLQWPAAMTKPIHMIPPPKMRNEMRLVVRPKKKKKKKTVVEQANVLANINHPSVVSWMHTNLYVLDLCGRSNLTKIHTSLSSRSQAMINENYLHRSKWASERKRGDRAGGHREMTNRWWETTGGTGLKKGWLLDSLSDPPPTPHPHWRLTSRLST